MSVETIRMVLSRLQDDPENAAAWNELTEAVTAPGSDASPDDVERLLGAARARHEQRRDWGAVARLLELELSFTSGSPVEVPMHLAGPGTGLVPFHAGETLMWRYVG